MSPFLRATFRGHENNHALPGLLCRAHERLRGDSITGCKQAGRETRTLPAEPANAYPSTYQAAAAAATLIRGATVLTGTGTRLDGADVLIANGHIEAVGQT
jgi:hypothetical protein